MVTLSACICLTLSQDMFANPSPAHSNTIQSSLIQKHLADEEDEFDRHYQRKVCQVIALIPALVSAIYAALLWNLFYSGWGALFDLLFVFLHLSSFYLINSGRLSAAAYWTLCLASVQVAVGVTLFVGPETGFQYYLLCLPVAVYLVLLREPAWRKFLVVILGFIMFTISERSTVQGFRVEIPSEMKSLMYYGNLTIVLLVNFFCVKFFAEEARSSYRQQKRLLLSDGLTGLSNRRYIVEFAYKLLALCKRYQHPISVIILDLDHFKQVNDRYGHHAGDDALQHVAECLRLNLRDSDVAARYGGEEFLILMPETELYTAEEIAERIRQELFNKPLQIQDESVSITASFGISCSDQFPDCDAAHLIKQADIALYQAKNAGRNCVRLADRAAPTADWSVSGLALGTENSQEE
ncbi:MAG: hypothetical protein C9356_03155 [Oleiphilus sp.]|nr:MAG: hypothetical protein C9356_03155 [Oleiphilus sp.]